MDQGEKYQQPYPSQSADPFSDRAPIPQGSYDLGYASQPGGYASNTSLAGGFGSGQSYAPQDEEEEKLPLTHGDTSFPAGAYYPPPG